MNELTLLPCPFCGGAAKWCEHDGHTCYYIVCSGGCGDFCLVTDNGEDTAALQAKAAIKWNTRPAPADDVVCIKPLHEAADAFWQYWKENGETHKHGYYESTWGAINAALKVAAAIAAPSDDVMEMCLCEVSRVFLKPDRKYIFRVCPDCDKCKRAAIAAINGGSHDNG